MAIDVLGVSGSPVKNSNTDRAVRAVLEASGLKTEFVKLSAINVRPCLACKRCVKDNVCRVPDDFPALAEKVKEARALVVGAYCPYNAVDGFTKAFLERLWSLRHVRNLVRGKLAVTVVTGLRRPTRDKVAEMMSMEMRMDRMDLLAQVQVQGNVPCLTCGKGDDCQMSGVKRLFGPEAEASAQRCVRVEEQAAVWEELGAAGRLIGERLAP